ncbi:TadA family conjugal transfer-associated ATPase [Cellulomonas bogoriensis]|uniref:TadA family conjugal transfer-associated ATPase n=1 Tax=Cellulomonas bogoriensis TaxID=301388 RepID=UPI00068BCABD
MLDAVARRLSPELVAHVRRRVLSEGLGPDDLAPLVREEVGVVGREDLAALVRMVRAEVEGAGPLQPLLDAPGVTDVLVNGPREVWVDRGAGLERADVDLGDEAAVRALAVRLASAGGQRLDDAVPVVDARLPDGTRLHAVLAPVAADGTTLSLRVLGRTRWTFADLVRCGTLPGPVGALLHDLVRGRANVLVSGGTGTGKTTLLSALLALVPADERIVVIEEAGELDPAHPHVVRLVSRRPNVEGAGEIGLAELVRQSLRMRPDRVVLGECRGAEVREVLSALNTGHDGGCATIHANTAQDVPARLEALGALAGLDREALAAQAVSALDAVVHLRRDGGRRYVSQVGVVTRERGGLQVVVALEVTAGGAVRHGPAWGELVDRWGHQGRPR